MNDTKPQLRIWLIGLTMFGILIAMSILRGDASPYTIVDHQAAGTAEIVDTIQASWREAGLRNWMIVSMLGDLIFIGFYGWGSFVAGRSLSRINTGLLRTIGVIVAAAAVIFLVTDYVETSLQLVQMLNEQGSDWMAATAATMQPIKIAAWFVTFLGVLVALVVRRFAGDTA